VRILFLIFIIVPLAEIMLLFEVSDRIGALTTIAMVVLTAIIGINVLKKQGINTLSRAMQRIQSGELPGQEIIEGMMLAISGALLLTPGFITDAIGFTFLVSPLRVLIAQRVMKSGVPFIMKGSSIGGHFSTSGFSIHSKANEHKTSARGGNIYEGEYVDEKKHRAGIGNEADNMDQD